MTSADTASLRALLKHPDALRVRKRAIPIRVAFAATDGTCETLEGPVRYRSGDALITGNSGDVWPVRRPTFDAVYRATAAAADGGDGFFVKEIAAALARRLDREVEVPVGWTADTLRGQPGDWLLCYSDETFGVVRDDIFRETYEADAAEARWPPPD